MATDTLPAESTTTNPVQRIYDLATEIQSRCSRVRSLSDAVEEAGDHAYCESNPSFRQRNVGNLINYAAMIEREVDDITSMGETIERLTYELKRDKARQVVK